MHICNGFVLLTYTSVKKSSNSGLSGGHKSLEFHGHKVFAFIFVFFLYLLQICTKKSNCKMKVLHVA